MDADKKRIWIRGQFVEVTDEVYRAYMQGDRKMRYFENDLKTERFVRKRKINRRLAKEEKLCHTIRV